METPPLSAAVSKAKLCSHAAPRSILGDVGGPARRPSTEKTCPTQQKPMEFLDGLCSSLHGINS